MLGKRWLRWTAAGLAAVALFILGVLYLNLSGDPEVTSFVIMGETRVRAGATSALRISARLSESRKELPVEVLGAEFDGQNARVAVDGATPAILTFSVPASAHESGTLQLRVSAGGAERAFQLPFEVEREPEDGRLARFPPKLSEVGERRHRVHLVPEAVQLLLGMTNRVFGRVRDPDGQNVEGARVRVVHKAFPDGFVETKTDGSGIFDFEVTVRQPSLRLDVEIHDGSLATKTSELMIPIGRRLLLNIDNPVLPPGTPATPTLTSWQGSATVYCDLRHEGTLLSSREVITHGGTAAIELGVLEPGVHQLFCYEDPGEAIATLPLVVADGDPLETLVAVARARGVLDEKAFSIGERTQRRRAMSYWLTFLHELPVRSEARITTRPGDVAAKKAVRDGQRNDVLLAIGLVFLLALAWVADMVLWNILKTRKRMREFAIEEAAEGQLGEAEFTDELGHQAITSERNLMRTRGVLVLVVLFGTLIANVVGFMWLIARMGQ